MLDIKQQIMDDIEAKSDVFYRAGSQEFRIRCPICGDSQKNPRDAHCYIKYTSNPAEPLLYICFKCNSKGIVNKNFLNRLHVKKSLIDQLKVGRYNRTMHVKEMDVDMTLGTPLMDSPQVAYLVYRLGAEFTMEDLERFKIVWNMGQMAQYVSSARVRNTMPSNRDSISFLSDDKSSLLIRPFETGPGGERWRTLSMIRSENRMFYTIKSTLNLFTPETIVVNIAEGIMDIISVYKNFNDGPNAVFIAALGSNYAAALEHMIAKGIIGRNVIVKVYVDSDIDMDVVKMRLKEYKWIFGSIILFRNVKSKDVGVPLSEIRLERSKL